MILSLQNTIIAAGISLYIVASLMLGIVLAGLGTLQLGTLAFLFAIVVGLLIAGVTGLTAMAILDVRRADAEAAALTATS